MDASDADPPRFRLPSIEDFEPFVGAETVARIMAKAAPLRDMHIVNINSTYYGGGVAELLSSLTLLMNSAGIRCGWRVHSRDGRIFLASPRRCIMRCRAGAINLSELKKDIYEQVVYEKCLPDASRS